MNTQKCRGCTYAGAHQEMGFKPFGVCTKATNLIEAEKAYNADICPYATQLTNYDSIKAMSVEETAKDRVEINAEWDCCYCSDGQSFRELDEAVQHEIEWLNSPAESPAESEEKQ